MKINNVVIIGAGTMGQGIAQWFLQQNCTVEMVDQNHEFALISLDRLFLNLDKLASKGLFSSAAVGNFKKCIHVKMLDALNPKADLVIEAIIENLDAKKKLLSQLDMMMSSETLFASNTSSFAISEMAQALRPERRKNFIGLHFFNPAPVMKLVEVINGFETNPELSPLFVTWFNERQKVACCSHDSPGFIVNRVARNFYGEALRSVGTFDPEKIREVDEVMKTVGGFKMGPFELMDLIGIDVNLSVTESVYRSFFDEPRFKPHRLQKELVAAGRLGKKTGKGFYLYE